MNITDHIPSLRGELQLTLTYHRKPTKFEIKFGHGATHYKDFPIEEVWDYTRNRAKRWVKCPIDNLRYYY